MNRVIIEDDYVFGLIRSWLSKRTRWFSDATEPEINLFVVNLTVIKNVFAAAELVYRTTGTRADSELISILLLDYNQHVINELFEKGIVT